MAGAIPPELPNIQWFLAGLAAANLKTIDASADGDTDPILWQT